VLSFITCDITIQRREYRSSRRYAPVLGARLADAADGRRVLRTQLRAAALASPSVFLSGRYSAHYRDYGIVYRSIGFRSASYAVLLLSRLGSRPSTESDLEVISKRSFPR
jgi:hypothetical protein